MYKKFFKRVFDIGFACLLLVIILPLFIIISILVYFKMGCPIFFRQNRTGRNQVIFEIMKFRTMKIKNNPEQSDSSRMTKLGYILRKTSLDELPQIINIVKGDMSFIGPRPLLPEYLSFYNKSELKRFDVRPGMSGYAEVKGRHKISWDDQFKYDVYYSDNLTFFLDIKIFLLTIPKVLHIGNVQSLSRENGRLDILRKKKKNIPYE